MSARAGLAMIVLALLWLGLGLAPLTAAAQERERRCYFGECPDEDSPQPPPPEHTPPDTDVDPGQYPDMAGDLPHYCCTAMGPLGPRVYGAPVGSPCSGMAADGVFYNGKTCCGDEQRSAIAAPSFCCTAAGRFGPFPNPGWLEGSACWNQTVYGPVQGMACY